MRNRQNESMNSKGDLMSSQLKPTIINQAIPPITPIDPKPIIEHGNSPTAIILAITILIAILISSMTTLIQVILVKQKQGRN